MGPSRNRELSEYVSLNYHVTPQAEITVGGRYIDFLNTGDTALATGAGGGSNQSGRTEIIRLYAIIFVLCYSLTE